MFATAVVALLVSTLVQAAPFAIPSCPISATPSFPAGQTQLSVTAPQKAEYVTVGVGHQNYTCTNGVYASIGAVASLYDASCFVNTPLFSTIQTVAYDLLVQTGAHPDQLGAKFPSTIAKFLPQPTLHHFFVPNPVVGGTGLAPRFNLDTTGPSLNPPLFFTGKKAGDLASPTASTNVDWLQLTTVAGSLALTTYRIQTVGGQPPSSCAAGAPDVSIPYAAQYWFLK